MHLHLGPGRALLDATHNEVRAQKSGDPGIPPHWVHQLQLAPPQHPQPGLLSVHPGYLAHQAKGGEQ